MLLIFLRLSPRRCSDGFANLDSDLFTYIKETDWKHMSYFQIFINSIINKLIFIQTLSLYHDLFEYKQFYVKSDTPI